MPDTSATRPDRDLSFLSSYLQSVRSYHADFVRLVAKGEPSPNLFHYTDLNGLDSIVSKHDLWLTHALYCNDEAEMKLGVEIARSEINQLEQTERKASAISQKLSFFTALDALLAQPRREGVYISCFCQGDDILSQWRAYGANGNGVSICMAPSAFEDYTGLQPFGFLSIWNVFYEPPQQKEIMARAIENTYNWFSMLPPEEIAKKAKDVIDFFVPTFKHECFKEEQEWRMIFAPAASGDVKPRYRAARDMLIPYYSLKDLIVSQGVDVASWRLPIKAVLIGPSRHRALNKASAESFLSDNGYSCPVNASATPYPG